MLNHTTIVSGLTWFILISYSILLIKLSLMLNVGKYLFMWASESYIILFNIDNVSFYAIKKWDYSDA